jgi:hypothetical protein
MRSAYLSALFCAALVSACAAPLALPPSPPASTAAVFSQPESNGDLVGIAISGGGSRAATFASYVLEELARLDVGPAQQPVSMLERVQYMSSVSGGSLSAAYFTMTKPGRQQAVLTSDGLTPAYEKFFRDYHSAMQTSWEEALWQVSLGDATRRAESISRRWDEQLFHNATFADMRKREQAGDMPRLVMNGTSWDTGRRVLFTTLPAKDFDYDFVSETLDYLQGSGMPPVDLNVLEAHMRPEAQRFRPTLFDEMGVDLGPLHVSVAVASSSSVPLLIGPVLFTVPLKDGGTQLLHIGDGGMFDNQGIESMAQLFFGRLRAPKDAQPPARRGLIVIVDASYPFDGSGGLLAHATSLLDLLNRSPSRVYDIMEQRAQAYQLMLWTVLRADAARRGDSGAGQVVPDTEHLRVIYLRHTDAAADLNVPASCDIRESGPQRVEKIRARLSQIPTRFKIDTKCDAPLLAAAAKTLVARERGRIMEFFKQ